MNANQLLEQARRNIEREQEKKRQATTQAALNVIAANKQQNAAAPIQTASQPFYQAQAAKSGLAPAGGAGSLIIKPAALFNNDTSIGALSKIPEKKQEEKASVPQSFALRTQAALSNSAGGGTSGSAALRARAALGDAKAAEITEPTQANFFTRAEDTVTGAIKNTAGSALSVLDTLNRMPISPIMSNNAALYEAHPEVNYLGKAADFMMESAAADTEKAKEGLGGVGRTAIDVGQGALQLLGDVGIAAATGGATLVPMAIRSFGGSAYEAKQAGGSIGEQVAYGGLSAATSALVERLSSAGNVLTKAYGKGALDDVMTNGLSKAISKAVKNGVISDRIATALVAAGGEGLEEVIESALSPVYQRLTYDPDARWNAGDILYDGLVGAIVGGLAGGIGGNNVQRAQQDAQAPAAAPTGIDTRTTENASTSQKSATDGGESTIVDTNPAMSPDANNTTGAMQTTDAKNAPAYTAKTDPANAGNANAPVVDSIIPPSTQNINTNIAQDSTFPEGQGAASYGFDPYSSLSNRFGAIPEGENPVRVVDVPLRTTEDNRVSRGVRTAMEAKATPDSPFVQQQLQDAVVDGKFSYMPITDNDAKARAESLIKDKGWENAVKDWTADARGGKVSKDLIVLGQTLYNNAVNSGNVKEGVDILVDLVKMSRSGAQATQANRVLKTLSPEYQLYALQRSVQNLSEDMKARLSKKGIENITIDPELAQDYINAQADKERDAAMNALKDNIAAQVPSTWYDKWNAWRYLSMLGNPRTHVRNLAGNLGFLPARAVKNVLAAGIEGITGTKQKTKAILTLKDRPLIDLARSDYNVVSDQIMQQGKLDNFTGDIDSRRRIFNNALMETLRKGNTKLLDWGDAIFSKPAYANALAGWYKANGVTAQQLSSGQVEASTIDKARAYAIREAQRATYRDSNDFSDWVAKLGRGYSGNNKAAKVANVLVEGVLPFKRTPANILTRAVEYSPAGLIKGLTSDLRKVHTGDMEAWQAIDNISAGLTGSGIVALGAWLASQGLISGGESDDEDEAALDKLSGYQNYALNVGGKSITLDWLAPAALPFFVGVELFNTFTDKSKEGVTLSDVLSGLGNIAEPMLEMSMLQGVNDLIDSVKYNDSGNVLNLAATAAVNYISQALPTLAGQIERTVETERETTHVDDTSGVPSALQYILGKAGNKVPFWDYQQRPFIDAFGNRQSSGSLGERAFNNFLNPAYVSDIKDTPVTDELKRLDDENYLGSAPASPGRSVEYGGEKHYLSEEEYTKFAEAAGRLTYEYMQTMIDKDAYAKMTNQEKADVMSKVYGYAQDAAKREYFEGKGVEYDTPSAFEKAYQAYLAGVAVPDYYEYKHQLDKVTGGETPTIPETGMALQRTDLTTQYKSELWQIQNSKSGPEKNPFTGPLAQAGVDAKIIIEIQNYEYTTSADKDAKGNSISGSKKSKVIEYAERRGLTKEQINALCEVYGWKKVY